MDDDRVPCGTLLGGKDARHGGGVEGIGAQAVDGFSGQGNQPAVAQNLGSVCDRLACVDRIEMRRIHWRGAVFSLFYCRRRRTRSSSAVYSLVTMAIETEIKFRVDDLAGLAARLEAAGFKLETPREFESNVLYDTPDRRCARARRFCASGTTRESGW